jgi:hypothetical protein
MHVSEHFSGFVRAVLLGALVIGLSLFLVTSINPPGRVQAQNAGVVGILARFIPVFTAATTSQSSKILSDIGQGVNILRFCDTGFVGTIDLEFQPNSGAAFQSLVGSTYNGDSSCHSLTVNGYFPNLRSTLTISAGTVSAWYSASSGPAAYNSGALGTTGPVIPILCDENGFGEGLTGVVTNLSIGGGIFTGNTTQLCLTSLSFNGTTGAGKVQIGFATSTSCTSPLFFWEILTTASTPQTVPLNAQVRNPQYVGGGPYLFPCMSNTSGATASISYGYAVVNQ